MGKDEKPKKPQKPTENYTRPQRPIHENEADIPIRKRKK